MERKFLFPMSAMEALAKAIILMDEEETKALFRFPYLRLIKNLVEGRAEIIVKPRFQGQLSPLDEKPRFASSIIASQAFIDFLGRLSNSGFTEENVNSLAELGFKDLRHVFLGKAEIKNVRHIIPCNERPANGFSPRLKIKKHEKIEPVVWEDRRCHLFRTKEQESGLAVYFSEVEKTVSGQVLANAVFAQYLVAHPWLIPDDWAGKNIFFPGTIFNSGETEYCLFMEKFPRDWNFQVSTLKRLGPNDFVMVVNTKNK